MLEKALESRLDCKEIKPVHPQGNQSWIFIGRTDAEAETQILWPPDVKNWLIGKDPDAGKDGRQEEKGTTEDEMAGWHHWLDRRESEWTPGVGDGQGSMVCYSPWGCKESDRTEQLNWTEDSADSGKAFYLSLKELPHIWGQGQWLGGATPRPRSGAAAETSNPTSKEQWPWGAGGLRGATPHSRSGGTAVRRYPSSKVRSSSCALLEQPWRDTPYPR